MKVTQVLVEESKNGTWLVSATINNLNYQQRRDTKPTQSQIDLAIESFKANYATLNDSNNKSQVRKDRI